jgi:iron(III) transport system ATP-binding protein
MSSLTVKDLTKSFGTTPVLTGVDLHVPTGSLTALLGPSGCGKTTLLRLIAGFDDPDTGTVAVGERLVAGPGRSVPARRRDIGFVPQEGGLFPHLSVTGNVTFGLPRRLRRDTTRVRDLLALVGLDGDLADRAPHQLSGGQQQRVALARALAPEPSIVLLDEPFSSLDAALREDTRQAVAAALTATGATAVLDTHDQAEAQSMADQVAVLRGGRLVQLTDPRTLYRHPADLDVATFVGESVVLEADVRGGRAQSLLGELALTGSAPEGPARVLLRPEQLRLGAPSSAGPRGRVRSVDFYGHDSRVWVDLPGGATVIARLEGAELPEPGQHVGITVVGAALPFPAAPGAGLPAAVGLTAGADVETAGTESTAPESTAPEPAALS